MAGTDHRSPPPPSSHAQRSASLTQLLKTLASSPSSARLRTVSAVPARSSSSPSKTPASALSPDASAALLPIPPPPTLVSLLPDSFAAYLGSPSDDGQLRIETLLAHTSASLDLYTPQDPAATWLVAAPALDRVYPKSVRRLALDVLSSAIRAASPDRAGDVGIFYSTLRSFASNLDDLDTAELEVCVRLLGELSRDGKQVRGLDGAVDLLCDWGQMLFERAEATRRSAAVAQGVLVSSAKLMGQGPLTDRAGKVPFLRLCSPPPNDDARMDTIPSAISLLTAFHKFSSPELGQPAMSRAATFVIQVALCSTNEDDVIKGLEFIDTVVRFGYIPKETLGNAVELTARVIGAEARVPTVLLAAEPLVAPPALEKADMTTNANTPTVTELRSFLKPGESTPAMRSVSPSPSPVTSSPIKRWIDPLLASLAKTTMRNLIRSPANQAVRSLRSILNSPTTLREATNDLSTNQSASPNGFDSNCDATLLAGAVRCLNIAFEDLDEKGPLLEVPPVRGGGEGDRYPALLTLGLPLLVPQLELALGYDHSEIDVEVLALIDDRLTSKDARRSGSSGSEPGLLLTEGYESPISKYDELDAALDIMRRAASKLQMWENQFVGKGTWLFQMDDFREYLCGIATGSGLLTLYLALTTPASSKSRAISTRIRSTSAPALTPLTQFANVYARLGTIYATGYASGLQEKLSALSLDVCGFMSDQAGLKLVAIAEIHHLCMPEDEAWLSNLEKLIKAFVYDRESSWTRRKMTTRAPCPNTRSRVMRFVLDTYASVRDLDPWRGEFLEAIAFPLIKHVLENEADSEVCKSALDLVRMISADQLLNSLVISEENLDHDDDILERLHKILYSISASTAGQTSQELSASESSIVEDRVHKAVLCLIGMFNDALGTSSRYAAIKCIDIFRDLLSLLSSNVGTMDPNNLHSLSHDLKPLGNPLAVQTRLAILQWAMRLRADQEHRVQFVRECDVSGLASLLQRTPERITHHSQHADATMGDRRGRSAAKPSPLDMSMNERGTSSRKGRAPSLTRIISQIRDRSPNKQYRATPVSTPTSAITPTVSTQPLWRVPETLPDDTWPNLIAPEGSDSLVAFDHKRLHDWHEATDSASTDLSPPPQTPAHAAGMAVLPISEYLTALIRLLRYEKDWELVSYILCYLPDQLSNKHLACGPKGAQQIHQLRRWLCVGIMRDNLNDQVVMPSHIKKTDAHTVAYQLLATLIAYRSLFDKQQQDEMVSAFARGLRTSGDTAKACIHAIAMACHELQPSVRKFLPEILTSLARILTNASASVHILELIAAMGQVPSLYTNLTEADFQTIFGIAIQYIGIHNQNSLDESKKASSAGGSALPSAGVTEIDEGAAIASAFQQYVYLLAYYIIAIWFVSLRLTERRKYVGFIVGKLVGACHGQSSIDEATEVCLDMIARYTYANAEPKPRPSMFGDTIASSLGKPTIEKSWILGNAVMTIKSLSRPGWAEISVRRPSGLVRMMVELENLGGTLAASEIDVLNMVLRHRDLVVEPLPESTPYDENLSTLPSPIHEGSSRRRAASFSVRDPPPLNVAMEQITLETVLARSSAIADMMPTYTELAADPSFFSLQLSSFPDVGGRSAPLRIPDDPTFARLVRGIDQLPVVDFHKISVVYVGPGQTEEQTVLGNIHGSKTYVKFLTNLGNLVRLQGCKLYYTGGLDTHHNLNGKWTYVWADDITQIAFHVATLMPTDTKTDPACVAKKALIGNDFVSIVFNDSGREYRFDTIKSQFNFINVIIEPHTPAGTAWTAPGMTNNIEFFRVSLQRHPNIPEIGPVGNFKMVSTASLPHFVRQLALHANIFSQIFLATVGVEAGRNRPKHKIEYVSHWRERLRQINSLKTRVAAIKNSSSPTVVTSNSTPTTGSVLSAPTTSSVTSYVPSPASATSMISLSSTIMDQVGMENVAESTSSQPTIDVDILSHFRDFSLWTE